METNIFDKSDCCGVATTFHDNELICKKCLQTLWIAE
jgi:hypothetical protein